MSTFLVSNLKERPTTNFDIEKKEYVVGHDEEKITPLDEALVYIYVVNGELQLDLGDEEQTIRNNEYTVLYVSEDGSYSYKAIQDTVFYMVQCAPDLLIERIGRLCCFIERILENVAQKQSSFLAEEPLKSSPGVLLTIAEVHVAMNKTEFQPFFLDACGFKLMGEFLEQSDKQNADCGHMRQEDIDKMYLVRSLIEENIHKPLSISELAKEVGTNNAYLKQQFKDTFGMTVYGYTQQYRMELSKKLLLVSDFSVSDVAFQVGYKHATHFSYAFKKFYGYLPNSIKRTVCLIFGVDLIEIAPFLCI